MSSTAPVEPDDGKPLPVDWRYRLPVVATGQGGALAVKRQHTQLLMLQVIRDLS